MASISKSFTIDGDILTKIRIVAETEGNFLGEQVSFILQENLNGKYTKSNKVTVIELDQVQKRKKLKMTVNIDEDLIKSIEGKSKEEGISTSRYINNVLKNFLLEEGYQFK